MPPPTAPLPARAPAGLAPVPLRITVRAGTGAGPTHIAAFDHALSRAGAADHNLLALSSVVPPGSDVVVVDEPRDEPPLGDYGDRLYCVLARADADLPGASAWAGLGWAQEEDGRGVFVEHHGESREAVQRLVHASLDAMQARRGATWVARGTLEAGVRVDREPACAVVLAAYETAGWGPRG